jgi:hypothetical protein
MTRYFARKGHSRRVVAHWADDVPLLPCLTVSDHEAADTGLVDKDGDPIMRMPNPVGFCWGEG